MQLLDTLSGAEPMADTPMSFDVPRVLRETMEGSMSAHSISRLKRPGWRSPSAIRRRSAGSTSPSAVGASTGIARPERRRQDDHDPNADDAAASRRRGGARPRSRRRPRGRTRCAGPSASPASSRPVDEDLTGRENLILIARLLGYGRADARTRAGELLEAFGLADASGRLVKNYSAACAGGSTSRPASSSPRS